ncbi:E3 ubiquitin--protein ligase [Bradyrhizobium sp. CCBAU 11386]|uniref:NEL-type E3 ubiquitin ligase domain-containing protein n=1 Tax=Bradyrhizobium sp. CCBAU 11386 TaxID=1630837 RepID=UPI0023033238|nr:NEL-type E3 ubiquitin ligase domain-containing protein [Bradyrhizobium sp. CCBAU 11386]MDA9505740.1 E3 ubiquitin--protein ligase [Bradyrhizobium sp. CCBAU 11386]
MNAEQVRLGAGTPSETSESEASERGAPAPAQWVEALTEAGTDAASSRDQVLAGWVAEEGQGEHENRQEAVSRMRDWREAGDVDEALDLSSLSLTALPAPLLARLRRLNVDDNQLNSLPDTLPAGLQRLYASNNRLTSLPDLPIGLRRLYAISNGLTSLPADLPPGLRRLSVDNNQLTSLPPLPGTLQELDASGNRLTSLPELPAELQRLNVDYNQLTNLPHPLPAGLEWLSASHNQLTSLPEPVPAELLWLGASNNQLTSVPETLLTQLGQESSVDLENNPLPEPVRTNLAIAMHAGDYAGPQIFFPVPEGAMEVEPRPLHVVIADWLADDPTTLAEWQHFADEPGAQDYARFLERLRGIVNHGNHEFRQAVTDDLRQAAANPRLREQFFTHASEANLSCDDRVTLHWNGMQTARLNADVEDGVYDDRLGELIQRGRVAFRLEALDGIARDRVNSLVRVDPSIDEIEVYLAYQHLLREPLELSHVAPNMQFLAVSHVTPDDAARALDLVREQEANQFDAYMATRWHPWETVLRRIAPGEHAAMQDRLVEAMGEEFQTRLNHRLAEKGLLGDLDAERVLGAQVRNQIAGEINREIMDRLLADRGLEQ